MTILAAPAPLYRVAGRGGPAPDRVGRCGDWRGGRHLDAPVAQRTERPASTRRVGGSNPPRGSMIRDTEGEASHGRIQSGQTTEAGLPCGPCLHSSAPALATSAFPIDHRDDLGGSAGGGERSGVSRVELACGGNLSSRPSAVTRVAPQANLVPLGVAIRELVERLHARLPAQGHVLRRWQCRSAPIGQLNNSRASTVWPGVAEVRVAYWQANSLPPWPASPGASLEQCPPRGRAQNRGRRGPSSLGWQSFMLPLGKFVGRRPEIHSPRGWQEPSSPIGNQSARRPGAVSRGVASSPLAGWLVKAWPSPRPFRAVGLSASCQVASTVAAAARRFGAWPFVSSHLLQFAQLPAPSVFRAWPLGSSPSGSPPRCRPGLASQAWPTLLLPGGNQEICQPESVVEGWPTSWSAVAKGASRRPHPNLLVGHIPNSPVALRRTAASIITKEAPWPNR